MGDNAPVRYSWNYEDYSDQMITKFGKLLQSQTLVDMTLMCSTHTLRVHKLVLAASSPYFQEILENQVGEPVVTLKMRFEILKSLVEFMYCGKTSCLEGEIDELVSAAQFLRIKGLSKITKEELGISGREGLPEFTPPVVISKPPPMQPAAKPPQETISTQTSPRASTGKLYSDKHADLPPMPQMTQFYPHHNTHLPSQMQYSNQYVPQSVRNEPSGNLFYYNSVLRGGYSLPKIMRRGGRSRLTTSNSRGVPKVRGFQRLIDHRMSRNLPSSDKYSSSCYSTSQEYPDNTALNRAIQSICEPSTSQCYSSVGGTTIYSDRSYKKKQPRKDPIPSSSSYYSSSLPETSNPNPIKTMTQYINKLKKAGLPTDLPILFQSSDGSYVNVNEQVLLDMVQSNEIQYEVIEEPIIDKYIDPNKTKSIDDLSKSLKTKTSTTELNTPKKEYTELTNVLPDDLTYDDSFSVSETKLSDFTTDNTDFCCIDGEMQYFSEINNDVKKYYEEQNLGDPDVMAQICGSSSSCEVLIEPIDLFQMPEDKSNDKSPTTKCFEAMETEDLSITTPTDDIQSKNDPSNIDNVENFINGSVIFKSTLDLDAKDDNSNSLSDKFDPKNVLDGFATACDQKETSLDENIPQAVGLMPLKSMGNILENSSEDDDMGKPDSDFGFDDMDIKCLRRRKKVKRA